MSKKGQTGIFIVVGLVITVLLVLFAFFAFYKLPRWIGVDSVLQGYYAVFATLLILGIIITIAKGDKTIGQPALWLGTGIAGVLGWFGIPRMMRSIWWIVVYLIVMAILLVIHQKKQKKNSAPI
jgi:uncharacterized membrane protein